MIARENEGSFWGDKNILILVVMIARLVYLLLQNKIQLSKFKNLIGISKQYKN